MNSIYSLIITSGPSCVGKSPLFNAFVKFYPRLASKLKKLVIYNSRQPRPKEVEGADYYFRPRSFISNLKKNKKFIVLNVRGDLQALDVTGLKKMLKESDVIFEGNPFIYKALTNTPLLKDVKKISIFISPLSKEEIIFFKSLKPEINLAELITSIMRRKLLRRTGLQKGTLSLPDLKNIETRAASAFGEMKYAYLFDYIIPNHDGEDSDNWDAFYYPIGDARKTLVAFSRILEGKPADCEKWVKNLL
ncbi:MAG: hypothetical protein PHQ96_03100 [Candidatus Omnitrophica bacterium]|nr:hypothetical protein [Candidatus Omnitrophota bacterium]